MISVENEVDVHFLRFRRLESSSGYWNVIFIFILRRGRRGRTHWSTPIPIEIFRSQFRDAISVVMSSDVSLATTACRESSRATLNRAYEWFLSSVSSHMLFKCALLVPSLSATLVFTDEWFLSSMDSSVNKKMSRSKKRFSTSRESTGMRFPSLSGKVTQCTLVVTPTVIHKVSLRIELTIAIGEIARVKSFFFSIHSISKYVQSISFEIHHD